MSLASSLVSYLKTKTAITDLVGDGANARIRAVKLNQGEDVPAIVYSIPSGEAVEHLGGGTNTEVVELEVKCYGTVPLEADQLKSAVKTALVGYRGEMGDVFIKGITLPSFFWQYEEPIDASDKGAHAVVMAFNVVYSE